jgi:D-serine dehydratase
MRNKAAKLAVVAGKSDFAARFEDGRKTGDWKSATLFVESLNRCVFFGYSIGASAFKVAPIVEVDDPTNGLHLLVMRCRARL